MSIARPVLFSALLFSHGIIAHNGQPQLREATLNLEAWEFGDGKPVNLNGEWEYYPGRLIHPSELKSFERERKLAHVPQSFNSYKDPVLALPAAANATYRIFITVPATAHPYVLRIPPPATASRIFLNGVQEVETGKVAEILPGVVAKNRITYLQKRLAGRNELVIQVSNAKNRKGGIWQSISIGPEDLMSRRRALARSTDTAIAAALVTFALYHIVLFLMRNPESSLVYYGLFCLVVGLRRLLTDEMLIAEFIPGLSWETHVTWEYFTLYGGATLFQLYVYKFFSDFKADRFLKALIWVSSLFAVSALLLPVPYSKLLLPPFQVYFPMVCAITFIKVIALSKRHVFGARIFSGGVFVLTVAFINDVLVNAEILRTPPLTYYAILAFILIQAFMISGKSVLIFRHNTELSQRLLRSDQLRDEFLTHTSQELRTPVQAMVQTIENLRRGVSGAVSEQVQRVLAAVEESGRRLTYLIDDLTDFVRLKQSDVKLNMQRVPLKKIVSPVLQLCVGLSVNKQLAFIDEIPPELQDVEVDPARIQQMLLNLLNTAIRYAHSSAITVRIGKLENQLALSVIYHGSDPDPRYTEVADTENEEVGPLVTQRLAELMGGKYIYQKYSESQHALSITLPYEHIETLEELIAGNKHRTEYRRTEDKNVTDFPARMTESAMAAEAVILVIGDSVSQNRLLQEQLLPLGKLALMAKNGAEAMSYLQNRTDIALVICDVLLPDVSGIELAMNIRVHFDIGLLPIILIIDNNQPGIAASAFSAGANDLIRRPFERAEVLARVKNVLLQREASLARENYRALNRELEIARSIQESILPISEPKSSHYKIEAVCMPARSIGGDFYDFIEDETSVAVLIADVAGHGIPAALYASMLKIAFHNLRDEAKFPEKLLKSLNDIMVDRGERTFISCAYTLIDFKNKRLLHANAGHLPLLLQEPGQKRVKKVHPPGGVLGVRKAAAITVEMLHLQPKTRLTLFTDGVIELVNRKGDFFEEERLIALLEDTRDLSIQEVRERLLADMRAFAEGEAFLDDVTFVILDV